MRKFLTLLVMLTIIFSATTSSAAADDKKPLRLARAPIIVLSTTPSADTMVELELKIARAVHLPLNGTLQAVDYIPIKETTTTFQKLWTKAHDDNKKAKYSEVLAPLAKKLKADMVICPVLKRFSQETFVGSSLHADSTTTLNSNVAVYLLVYDARTDELISKAAARSYNGEFNTLGTASFLANECMSRVIDQTGVRNRILSYALSSHKAVERNAVDRKIVERQEVAAH